jgi:uncharacterized SAM-binding protein YcdF (DUF218 family)
MSASGILHHIASSIIGFFVSPVGWILLLIILPYFFHQEKFKKKCRITAWILFFIFSNEWLINWYAHLWQPPKVEIPANKGYSCGILLGGFGSSDENYNGYFNQSADRFIQAVELYKQGSITHILIDGGNDKFEYKKFDEGQWTIGQLNKMGIPDSVILSEDHSTNTSENAIQAKRILDSAHLLPPYVLITSAQHIPRASLLFKKHGMDVIPYPCAYISGNTGYSIYGIIPKPEILLSWNFYFKEFIAYYIYKIK